jgi:hypothetical protein
MCQNAHSTAGNFDDAFRTTTNLNGTIVMTGGGLRDHVLFGDPFDPRLTHRRCFDLQDVIRPPPTRVMDQHDVFVMANDGLPMQTLFWVQPDLCAQYRQLFDLYINLPPCPPGPAPAPPHHVTDDGTQVFRCWDDHPGSPALGT